MCAYQDDVQQLGLGDLFVTFRLLGILVGQIMHSVKLCSLVCAITVHLLLVLFEGHGN